MGNFTVERERENKKEQQQHMKHEIKNQLHINI